MTHKDIYEKFMIEYDKTNITSSYPSLTKYEVATLLDKAYLALIAQKITGNNPRKVGFESDVKSIEDLRPLITTKQITDTYDTDDTNTNELQFKIPNEFLYYVSSQIELLKNKTSIDSYSHHSYPVSLINHQVSNNFKVSATNMPWIKQPVAYIQTDTVNVLVDPYQYVKGTIGKLDLTFIKKPVSFTIGKDTEIQPTPDDYPEEPIVPGITWTYLDWDNSVIASYKDLTVGTSSTNYIPHDPERTGYQFNKWVPDIPDTIGERNVVFRAYYVGDEVPDIPEGDTETDVIIKVTVGRNADGSTDIYGTVSGSGTYTIGSLCRIVAIPRKENASYTYEFVEWMCDDQSFSYNSECVFTVTGAKSYQAVFSRTRKEGGDVEFNPIDPPGRPDQPDDFWIDLGLPSGTLWAKQYNKESVLGEMFVQTPEQVQTVLSNMSNSIYDLPTQEQYNELIHYCQRTQNVGNNSTFVGPNGNSINFQARAYDTEDGHRIMGAWFFTKKYQPENGRFQVFEAVYGGQLTTIGVNNKRKSCQVRAVKRNPYSDQYFKVSATVIPANTGVVKYKNADINNAADFRWASILTVEAVPNEGYKFSHWQDDNSTSATKEINVTRATELKAVFVRSGAADKYYVKIRANDDSLGWVFQPYDQEVNTGAVLEVVVVPQDGCKFDGWSDGVANTVEGMRRFVVDRDIDVTANFSRI